MGKIFAGLFFFPFLMTHPWDERYIYLLLDPIEINHSCRVNNTVRPMDPMGS